MYRNQKDKEKKIRFEDIHAAFPNQSETSIRKKLKVDLASASCCWLEGLQRCSGAAVNVEPLLCSRWRTSSVEATTLAGGC
jgi:hypothetical protein